MVKRKNFQVVNGRAAGFTLIEMMIVLLVIGILSAIAYPTYTRSVIRSNQTQAQSFLLELAQRQDQYLIDRRQYSADLADLNLPIPDRVDRHYTINVAAPAGNPPAFTITATPKAGTVQKGEETLSIDQTGLRLPADLWE